MRFLIIPRPAETSENGEAELASCDVDHEAFDEAKAQEYMEYNEALARAGVLVAAEGLNPSAPAIQVGARSGKRAVVDGPFAETKELVGGFYIIDVESRDEAIRWALRCPISRGHEVLEIRQLTELADLPSQFQELIRSRAPTWSSLRWPKPSSSRGQAIAPGGTLR